jgi:hypothetical protein
MRPKRVSSLLSQVIQLAGAALILAGFVASLAGVLSQKSCLYLTANAIGSAALAIIAGVSGQWGFLLLEGSWAIVSVVGLLSALAVPGRAAGPRAGADDRDVVIG